MYIIETQFVSVKSSAHDFYPLQFIDLVSKDSSDAIRWLYFHFRAGLV